MPFYKAWNQHFTSAIYVRFVFVFKLEILIRRVSSQEDVRSRLVLYISNTKILYRLHIFFYNFGFKMQSITKYNETFHFTFCYNVKLMCWCMSNITLWAKVSSRGDSTYMNQNPSECMYTNIFVFWGEKIKRTEFDQFHKFPFESRKRFFFLIKINELA